jgi:hypothetical protein
MVIFSADYRTPPLVLQFLKFTASPANILESQIESGSIRKEYGEHTGYIHHFCKMAFIGEAPEHYKSSLWE